MTQIVDVLNNLRDELERDGHTKQKTREKLKEAVSTVSVSSGIAGLLADYQALAVLFSQIYDADGIPVVSTAEVRKQAVQAETDKLSELLIKADAFSKRSRAPLVARREW